MTHLNTLSTRLYIITTTVGEKCLIGAQPSRSSVWELSSSLSRASHGSVGIQWRRNILKTGEEKSCQTSPTAGKRLFQFVGPPTQSTDRISRKKNSKSWIFSYLSVSIVRSSIMRARRWLKHHAQGPHSLYADRIPNMQHKQMKPTLTENPQQSVGKQLCWSPALSTYAIRIKAAN